MKKENGFTLVELLAVIVILSIILAIALPSISSIIKSVTKNSFESDTKLLLKAVHYKKLQEDSFDPTTITKSTLTSLLNLSDDNYSSVTIVMDGTDPVISIIGTGKWDGFMSCGTYKSMKVVESAADCSDDTVHPVIALNGTSTVSINLNQTYTDAGATATDNIEGDITSEITKTGTVTTSTPGNYTITYSVTDAAGNVTTATRTVTVVDNVAPTVAFGTNGSTTWAKSRTTTVTLSDVSGLNASSLEYQWTTSTTAPTEASFTTAFTNAATLTSPASVTGTYYLWILGKDTKGNTMIARSNVFNLDNTKPVITLTGSATVTIALNATYTDAGATATDAHSGLNGSVVMTGSVNTAAAGTYTLTYNVSDKATNAATAVTRTVTVQ